LYYLGGGTKPIGRIPFYRLLQLSLAVRRCQRKGFYRLSTLAAAMAESAFPRKAKTAISLLLIIGGVLMYVGWGIMYGSWNIFTPEHMGVYVIVVTLLAFGVLGLLLVSRQSRQK